MTDWLLIVFFFLPPDMQPVPDVVMPMASEAECLEAARDWPQWRSLYDDGYHFSSWLQDARCQQRADYKWGLGRSVEGVWE